MAALVQSVNARNLRQNRKVKVYDDDEEVEDEIDGKRSYNVLEKVQDNAKYCDNLALEMNSKDFSFQFVQRNGLQQPIHFVESEGLGMKMPDRETFSVSEIRSLVGGRRMLDVMECKTQRELEMSMRDFAQYFEGENRDRLYNVISLEFSHTRLEPLIERPKVVDNMDWIDLSWPPHLKYEQHDQTNKMEDMKYPKVQKYCLMSVQGCYTDFHIDFGGTSVWYHILKGGKIFWLIPPTNRNLELYERWTMSGRQGDIFFADVVEDSQKLVLETGDSLMIPSGWIHAVYTPYDSIVFGGNFLHSFNIPMQLRIAQIEERLHVPSKFRFPFYSQLLWYVIERYVWKLTGKSYLIKEYQDKSLKGEDSPEENGSVAVKDEEETIHITQIEYKGLQKLLEKLEDFSSSERYVPPGISDPEKLLKACKQMLWHHQGDDPELAITGKSIPGWPKRLAIRKAIKRQKSLPAGTPTPKRSANTNSGSVRVRKIRCKTCEACTRTECGKCNYCRDMKKFGGPGTMKQTCILRRCTNPILPGGLSASAIETPKSSKKEEIILYPVEQDENIEAESSNQAKDQVKKEKSGYRSNKSAAKDKSLKLELNRISDDELFTHTIRPTVSYDPDASKTEILTLDLEEMETCPNSDAVTQYDTWKHVFKFLSQSELCTLMRVSKLFLSWCSHPQYWEEIDLSDADLTQETLQCISRRTPLTLNLERTNVSFSQLSWIISKNNYLKNLKLGYNSWAAVSALNSADCPFLHSLDLSWVNGFNDSHLAQLVSVPTDGKPSQQVSSSSVKLCKYLNLTGTDITNAGVKLLCSKLPQLYHLNISYCDVTDEAVRCIVHSASGSQNSNHIHEIVAKSCPNITNKSLNQSKELRNLNIFDFSDCTQISESKCKEFVSKNPEFCLLSPKYICKILVT